MSLIYVDGFDDNMLTQKWTAVVGSPTTPSGRNGNGLHLLAPSSNSTSKVSKQVAAADEHATFIVGFAYKPANVTSTPATNSTYGLVAFLSDSLATSHLTLCPNADGTVSVRRGGIAGTVLGTSVVSLTAGVFQYIEMKATLHDSTGIVTVKLNGTAIITLTGQDTKNAGTKTVFDGFGMGVMGGIGSTTDYDDLYLCNGAGSVNNDFLGDVAVETLLPSGNGSNSQFVGSDGNSTDNYLLVDESTPSSTDYAGSATSGNKDSYAMADLSRATGTVFGVVANPWVGNSDAGAQNFKHVCKSSGTTDVGTSTAINTTYQPYQKVYELNPDSAGAWTVTTVNAAEFGAQVT